MTDVSATAARLAPLDEELAALKTGVAIAAATAEANVRSGADPGREWLTYALAHGTATGKGQAIAARYQEDTGLDGPRLDLDDIPLYHLWLADLAVRMVADEIVSARAR